MNKGIIYHIINHANNWIYVGSTLNEVQRLNKHIRHLAKNKHYNKAMQKDFNEFGSENFSVDVVTRDIPEDVLHLYEMAQIAAITEQNAGRIYNKGRARRISPERRQLIAQQRLQRLHFLYDRKTVWSPQQCLPARTRNGRRLQNSSSDCTPTITLPSMLVLPL